MQALKRLTGLGALVLSLTLAQVALAATPLVSTDWLAENLKRDDTIVLDIRSPFAGSSREAYLEGHIPGALWSEYPGYWRTDRGDVVGVLPSVEKLEAALSELGVADGKTVVIVPAGGNSSEFSAAARIYWTLKYLGHDEVSILDGGHRRWTEEKRPLETGAVTPVGDMFVAEPRADYLTGTSDVARRMNTSTVLIDGRPASQFAGQAKHSKATRFGRIPGAVSLDQGVFYDDKAGRLKAPSEIAKLVPQGLDDKDVDIVSYCNTGHWAATNWFVMHELLGYKNVSLYDESMVGWSQDESLPIASERTMMDDVKAFFSNIFS
ncbi:sulfurtransferase [Stappia sp. ICDLI1TA098]